jgi:hypothetical protein
MTWLADCRHHTEPMLACNRAKWAMFRLTEGLVRAWATFCLGGVVWWRWNLSIDQMEG